MKLSDLLATIQPVRIAGSTNMEITGVNIDSRLIETGHLFMAMRGTQTDGHAYIPAAIDKGAVAVLCEELPEELKTGTTYILVKDSEDAVGKVATTFYGDPTSKMELIGVTGTNGKTTVATLLYNVYPNLVYSHVNVVSGLWFVLSLSDCRLLWTGSSPVLRRLALLSVLCSLKGRLHLSLPYRPRWARCPRPVPGLAG